MDKENAVCTYNGISFSLTKGRNSDTRHSVDTLGGHMLSEISQSQILYDSLLRGIWSNQVQRDRQ